MDQHTQKKHTSKQSRFGKVAITAGLTVALGMMGLIPVWDGNLGVQAGDRTILQSTPPANDSMCTHGLVAVTEPARLALATNAYANVASMAIRDLLDETTTEHHNGWCHYGYCYGVWGFWCTCY